jgi:Uma2 family endonuclease
MVQLKERTTSPPKQQKPQLVWELLPEDFILPDEPVESIIQPLWAAALTEALDLAGLITATMMIATNMALTTKIDGKTVVKAPDWYFVANVVPPDSGTICRSYTPHREGEIPTLVMEFLSDTDGGEYSSRPYPPYGKMWFYEKILQVPIYLIFEPNSGLLEIRQLNAEGNYELQTLDHNGRFYLECLNLYIGVWQGQRLGYNVHWLRWWDQQGNLLSWGSELIQQEKERTQQEKERADQEKQRADQAELELAKLRQLLLEAGLS